MSDTKHTPAPWTAKPSKYDYSVWACDGDMKICDMRGWGYLTGGGALDLPFEEAAAIQDANKALIIAAPDLLAALQGVLRVADRTTDEFDAARAAIAKATGEKQ